MLGHHAVLALPRTKLHQRNALSRAIWPLEGQGHRRAAPPGSVTCPPWRSLLDTMVSDDLVNALLDDQSAEQAAHSRIYFEKSRAGAQRVTYSPATRRGALRRTSPSCRNCAWRCIGEAASAIEATKERWWEVEVHRTARVKSCGAVLSGTVRKRKCI
jgi:hypothetical protein